MNINEIIALNDSEKKELFKKTENLLVESKLNFSFTTSEKFGVITGIGIEDGIKRNSIDETDLLLQYLLLKKLLVA
jgi:hypothetical protein